MEYSCKTCGAPVQVNGEEKVRSCECDAPVVASMEGTAHGFGGLST